MEKIINTIFNKNDGDIYLYKKGIQDADFVYLLTKETRKVQQLNLGQNKLGSLSMLRMKEAKWDSLTYLWLSCNIFGNKGCKYISRVSIPQINKIDLKNNNISSLGMYHLAKAEWKNLQVIYFGENKIGFDGVKRLSSAKWSKKLNQIYLRKNQLFVGQIYRLILCEKEEPLELVVGDNKIEQCYISNLKFTLNLKSISLILW